jgi:hypothetical protein
MIAYKLLTKRQDGTLGPLFINRKQRVPIGEWLEAEDHETKGYAHRPGWHTTSKPEAPHIAQRENRVWCLVKIEDYTELKRPESQGGLWYLANRMKIEKEL